MNCEEIEPWLAAKADGSFDPGRARVLDQHLATCDACRRALDHQVRVCEALTATAMVKPRADFAARINARIDATEGWLGMADFRAWTLRLAPAAAAVALIAMLWPASSRSATSPPSTANATFSPASIGDWDRDVSPNALLEAALRQVPGDAHVR